MDMQELIELKKDIDTNKNTLKLIAEKKITSAKIVLHTDGVDISVTPIYESDMQMIIATAGELIEDILSINEDRYREILQELLAEIE